ncbi:VOC family protein [Mucilaginibacter auburnensis]|uniref:Putative glyoxalase superfamily protein PhnB n=1 Tax=Mucilaginibacter auburnensis TaxID=1457233 RepID=A0A2H9VTX0_9SPHI|nr:extradiol dioxygenase [Mucilaginibacter auburnensis]PJJ84261.1 putative glyoxalase superfamily protein PhnB [Mucilaginibacter auburnensis]
MYKPENYNSLSSYLIVDNAQQLADMLVTIFNGKELRKYNRPNGSVMHMEVQLDDSILMLSDATADYPAQKAMLHMYVPDVMATYNKAIETGCTAIEEPVNKPSDPDKRGAFLDSAGNYWAVSTQMGN